MKDALFYRYEAPGFHGGQTLLRADEDGPIFPYRLKVEHGGEPCSLCGKCLSLHRVEREGDKQKLVCT